MQSFKEWSEKKNEQAQVSQESWGFEISGTIEEVIQQLGRYPKWWHCVASAEHGANQPAQVAPRGEA